MQTKNELYAWYESPKMIISMNLVEHDKICGSVGSDKFHRFKET